MAIGSFAEHRDGQAPAISVLMAVFNAATHLQQAVESILCQSETDFELVIVDDGSTDGSEKILEALVDERIRLLRRPHAGLTAALNAGLEVCRGEFIARMDADDIAAPERLEVQREFLLANCDVDIVCSDIIRVDLNGHPIGEEICANFDNDALRESLLYRRRLKPVIHPTIMMRRAVFERVGGYRDFRSAEDHDLWLRCVDEFRFERLSQKLLRYRVNPGGISRSNVSQQRANAAMSAVNYLVKSRTGVDLFETNPGLFARTLNAVESEMDRAVAGPVSAFERVRSRIRERRLGAAAVQTIAAGLRFGPAFLPPLTQARLCKLVDSTSRELASTLRTSVSFRP
jgi:glycosyltransferase involved in cell wall biosynthesis